uniref:rhomboid protease n=1 Tax=Helicotheca tamesis TaxID=374047 RepID=A0A7S2N158_9STRA|mmetsp:Transcript_7298/g.9934  ORF Transcript_7298/g.9934 Transcript_7298/m.9934 type:complete len:410 (+) Transcript_7298:43-1272(+)
MLGRLVANAKKGGKRILSTTTSDIENSGDGPISYIPPAAPPAQTLAAGDDEFGDAVSRTEVGQGMESSKGMNSTGTHAPRLGNDSGGDAMYQSMGGDQTPPVSPKEGMNTHRPTSATSFDYADDDSYGGGLAAVDSDYYYVKQKFGYLSIGLSTTQLFVLAVQMLLCGVAPFDVNPMIGPYPDVLSEWGGRNTYMIVERLQIWRLITPCVLHTGVIHLLCNVAVQLETAAFFEREWGSLRWGVLYLSGVFGCNMAGCLLSPDQISVGSSGALMGIFGAKLAEVATMSLFQTKLRRGELGNLVRLEQVGGVMCAVLVVGLFTLIPFVDLSGHFGGLCGGFVSGVVLFSGRLRSLFLKFFWSLAGIVLFVFGCIYSLIYLFQNVQANEELGDVCEYFRRLYAEGYNCECYV